MGSKSFEAVVADEIARGEVDEAAMAEALCACGGNQKEGKKLYITVRVLNMYVAAGIRPQKSVGRELLGYVEDLLVVYKFVGLIALLPFEILAKAIAWPFRRKEPPQIVPPPLPAQASLPPTLPEPPLLPPFTREELAERQAMLRRFAEDHPEEAAEMVLPPNPPRRNRQTGQGEPQPQPQQGVQAPQEAVAVSAPAASPVAVAGAPPARDWQGEVIGKYPEIGKSKSPENLAFVAAYKKAKDEGASVADGSLDPLALADRVMRDLYVRAARN